MRSRNFARGTVRLAVALVLAAATALPAFAHDPSLQAIAEYNAVLERNPDDLEALRARGSTFRALELYDDALNDLTRADGIQPGYAETVSEIGICRYMLGELDVALEILLRSEKLLMEQTASGELPPDKSAPVERELRETLVRLYRDRKEYEKALEQCAHLEQYLEGKLAFKCDKADLLLGLGDVNAALLLYEEAVEWNPVFERHCVGAANGYILAGLNDKAIEVFENWTLEEPDNPLPHMFRSLVLRDHIGDREAAAVAAAEAVRLARAKVEGEDLPDFDYIINLARALQAAGAYEESAREIGAILEYARGHYLVTAIQAANFRALGREDEALSFERETALYKRLNPNDWLQGYDIIPPQRKLSGQASDDAPAATADVPEDTGTEIATKGAPAEGGSTDGENYAEDRMKKIVIIGLMVLCGAVIFVALLLRRRTRNEL